MAYGGPDDPTMGDVRVRFAPAPTGFLHVGSARAALFNWLFARHVGGTFVLRIEDTDPERSRDELVEGIERSLKWLGLDWDEGPYRQSERMHLYREAAERLVAEGGAYYCDCTKADIEARTPSGGYDGFCRDRGLGPGPGRALRFRTPDAGETVVHDVIRGDVVFENATLEDFVILRAGGEPMFILANAVDDADMGITHVLRGEDLLSSTPKVLLLRHALGYDRTIPLYGHLPVIVNEKRQKLSKRRDDVALEEFRERGYLPQAMRNYLALLGWGPPSGKEILPIAEMVEEFRLEDVQAVARLLRRPEARPRQRRVHPGPARHHLRPGLAAVAGGRPAVAAGELRPGHLRGDGPPRAGAGAHAVGGAGRGRLPLPRPARDRPRGLGEGRGQGQGRGRAARRRGRRLRRPGRLDGAGPPRGDAGGGGGPRAQAGQGPGAHPGGRHRPHRRARRCSSR